MLFFELGQEFKTLIVPLASFLFVGPTGVGKTEVALTIAEQLFDQKKNLIRLDMTEFSEPHSISKLLVLHLVILALRINRDWKLFGKK